MTGNENVAYTMPERQEIRCRCAHVVFDRLIVRCRVLRVNQDGSVEGKCRCKRWVPLPLLYCAATE